MAAILGLVALGLLVEAKRLRERDEEAKIERNRRLEIEERLKVREEQLDGALGRIHELRPDGPEPE